MTAVGKTLYLTKARAQRQYVCAGCGSNIAKGTQHYRHEPHPFARQYRGEERSHWCHECITSVDTITDQVGHIYVPLVRVLDRRKALDSQGAEGADSGEYRIARVQLIGVGQQLSQLLAVDPARVHELSAPQFEDFMCERLFAMGFEPKKTGATYAKDGGIDILFWPRQRVPFPMLGAMQLKHHASPTKTEGVGSVRDFAGAIAGHPFGVGVLVTNTTFSPDAHWFANKRTSIVRLRDFSDIRRWVADNFADDLEWRELPTSIELCPGVVVPVGRRSGG